MYNKIVLPVTLTCCSLMLSTAHAASIGTYSFDDNAYADELLAGTNRIYNGTDWYFNSGSSWLVASGGSWTATSTPTDVTDTSTSSYLAAVNEADSSVDLTIGFTDNTAINGAGDDLVLFFLWDQQDITSNSITINGVTASLNYNDVYDGHGNLFTVDGVNWSGAVYDNVLLTAATIDLSDFGIADGSALLSPFEVNLFTDTTNAAALSLVAALNSGPAPTPVPLPATLLLFLSGLTGLGLFSRRK